MRWIILTFLLGATLPLSFVEASSGGIENFLKNIEGNYQVVRDHRFPGLIEVKQIENGDWSVAGEVAVDSNKSTIIQNVFRLEREKLFKIETNDQGQEQKRLMNVVKFEEGKLKFIDLYSLRFGDVYDWALRQDGVLMMNSALWRQVQTGDYREVHPYTTMKMIRVK